MMLFWTIEECRRHRNWFYFSIYVSSSPSCAPYYHSNSFSSFFSYSSFLFSSISYFFCVQCVKAPYLFPRSLSFPYSVSFFLSSFSFFYERSVCERSVLISTLIFLSLLSLLLLFLLLLLLLLLWAFSVWNVCTYSLGHSPFPTPSPFFLSSFSFFFYVRSVCEVFVLIPTLLSLSVSPSLRITIVMSDI